MTDSFNSSPPGRDPKFAPTLSEFSPLLTSSVVEGSVNVSGLERAFVDFLSRWRASIGSLLPSIEVDTVWSGVDVIPFRTYLDSTVDLAEIHVFQIEEIDAQCAWIFDRRLISYAVDCLFGGSGDIPPSDLERRYTAVDLSVRHRLISFLVLAFEGSFPHQKSVRLKVARQERRVSHLQIAEPDHLIVRARFTIRLNRGECPIEFCAPLGAIRYLLAQGGSSAQSVEASSPPSSTDPFGDDLPVEVVAVLAETDISVAQLAALSLGQEFPLSMENESVRLHVDGSVVMTGRAGSRSGNYAVKIEDVVRSFE
jgi:flagellar motor switch protein FliM